MEMHQEAFLSKGNEYAQTQCPHVLQTLEAPCRLPEQQTKPSQLTFPSTGGLFGEAGPADNDGTENLFFSNDVKTFAEEPNKLAR